jgi:hypothetical protein
MPFDASLLLHSGGHARGLDLSRVFAPSRPFLQRTWHRRSSNIGTGVFRCSGTCFRFSGCGRHPA